MQLTLRAVHFLTASILLAGTLRAVADDLLPTTDGFRGIWYANQPSGDEYKFKYSGGMGTYPQQHTPIAIYSQAADKTFFCYGGRPAERNRLLHMISYYDHATGLVARPRILLDKQTDDAHDNPTMQIDDQGHVWIFSNSHGTGRPSYIHRSRQPYAIDSFELVRTTNFSYGQPWHVSGQGFVFLHTLYDKGRRFLHVSRSGDGRTWEAPQLLARAAEGHYQISARNGQTIATAFNYHPAGKGLNHRTNLYYMQTSDSGRTWQNVQGETLTLPLTEPRSAALALEYESRGLLVYLKDVQFTTEGRPVVLFLTTSGYEAGPKNDPRTFTTACWTGGEWEVREVTHVDNAYDYGSLYIEADGAWRIIGTTDPGPQLYNTGGEVAIWLSRDQGATWERSRQLTANSQYNHNYPRRPLNAHPDFYSLWADGNARELSSSRLYFTDKEGMNVWRLPEQIPDGAEMVQPEPMH
jgi:hypothetical protein